MLKWIGKAAGIVQQRKDTRGMFIMKSFMLFPLPLFLLVVCRIFARHTISHRDVVVFGEHFASAFDVS
jgi:ABC-type dipeptide/oligopeptide/nickel transport system permease subunit